MIRRILVLSLLLMTATSPVRSQIASSLSNDETPTSRRTTPPDDGQLGSTMTLEQIQKGSPALQARTAHTPRQQQPLVAQAAREPEPALRYRFHRPQWTRKAGSAQLYYCRALALYLQQSADLQSKIAALSQGDRSPDPGELASAMKSLDSVFDELRQFAVSDDLTWDHRIRDLKGPAVYMYLLSDVQEVRTMARLLRLRVTHELNQRNFDEVVHLIADGYRLAEFVGQGETVIQKLVGIACANLMLDAAREAVQTPGCPNLYWALASVPQPLVCVRSAVQWELNNVSTVFPVFQEAETATWTEQEATSRWSSTLDDMESLINLGNEGSDSRSDRLTLSMAGVMFAESARQRLSASGVSLETLASMPPLQVVLVEAARDLRRMGDDMEKGYLLPDELSRPILERENRKFEEWVRANRASSVSAIIGRLLFPAVHSAKGAETRMVMLHNRLMTIEALRMHAAAHDGDLPASLEELSPVPALPDAMGSAPFGYRVDVVEGKRFAVLTADVPAHLQKEYGEIRLHILK